jgi:parvulin-like peptidyl-prolyl isomerase
LTQTAFSLEVGETSSFIDSGDGIYLVRRLPKDDAYLSDAKNLPDFTEYYLLNTFYRMLAMEAEHLVSTAVVTSLFETLSLDTVQMAD